MTPADLSAILAAVGGPWALVGAVALVLFGPKLTPLLSKLGPLLAAIRKTPAPAPVDPAKPVEPATPILDLLKLLLARKAAAAGKAPDVAFEEWLTEKVAEVAKEAPAPDPK